MHNESVVILREINSGIQIYFIEQNWISGFVGLLYKKMDSVIFVICYFHDWLGLS